MFLLTSDIHPDYTNPNKKSWVVFNRSSNRILLQDAWVQQSRRNRELIQRKKLKYVITNSFAFLRKWTFKRKTY